MAGENPAPANSSGAITRVRTWSNNRSILYCPTRKEFSATAWLWLSCRQWSQPAYLPLTPADPAYVGGYRVYARPDCSGAQELAKEDERLHHAVLTPDEKRAAWRLNRSSAARAASCTGDPP